jgi:hypothetical protein
MENVRSIAVPPLRAGLGGLEWDVVKPLIIDKLIPLEHFRVVVFAPLPVHGGVLSPKKASAAPKALAPRRKRSRPPNAIPPHTRRKSTHRRHRPSTLLRHTVYLSAFSLYQSFFLFSIIHDHDINLAIINNMGAEPSPAAVAFAASVGLPKSAASLSPLTLLWLASRLDEAAVRKAAAAIKRDAQENGDEKRGKKDGPVPNGTTHTNGDSKPNGDSNGNGNGAVATEEGEDTEGEDEAPPRTEWWWRRMNSRNIRPMPVLEDYADHLRKATTVRPVTAFNSRILVQLLPLLFPRLVVLARNNTKYLKYALLYLSSVILTGLLPTGL